MKRKLTYAIFTAILALASTAGAVDVVNDEGEPNNNFASTAPMLNPTEAAGTVEVNAYLDSEDRDLFKVYVKETDTIEIDIDGKDGTKGAYTGFGTPDIYLAVITPDLTAIEREGDDGIPVDDGSMPYGTKYINGIATKWSKDPAIHEWKPKTSGYYIIGVTHSNRRFITNAQGLYDGGVASGFGGKGPYKLIISGISPAFLPINIDVKPGQTNLRTEFNPNSNAKIPVALLSSKATGFYPHDVDRKSLTFGINGDEVSLHHCEASTRDLNNDGEPDLVCHFENQIAFKNYQKGLNVLEGVLKGKYKDRDIKGQAPLKVLSQSAD